MTILVHFDTAAGPYTTIATDDAAAWVGVGHVHPSRLNCLKKLYYMPKINVLIHRVSVRTYATIYFRADAAHTPFTVKKYVPPGTRYRR